MKSKSEEVVGTEPVMIRPKICLVDENPLVKRGWEESLEDGDKVDLIYFQDYMQLMCKIEEYPSFLSSIKCIIFGKTFLHLPISDITQSDCISKIRQKQKMPIFLNWQGFVDKKDSKLFDGKIFHRYGVKWHTLKHRIQKLAESKRKKIPPISKSLPSRFLRELERQKKCEELLLRMATKADGEHKKRIEELAHVDKHAGIQLLEAIYNRLLIEKNRPNSCPSRYINTSPIIAVRILQDVLFN